MPESVFPEAARSALALHIKDVDGYVASGQLEMFPHPTWYLDARGHLKSFEQIAEALLDKQDRALANAVRGTARARARRSVVHRGVTLCEPS